MSASRLASDYCPLAGRILLSIVFFNSGLEKIFAWGKFAAMTAAKGIPLPEVALALTIALVLAGGAMILTGWHARCAALALFVWMIPTTLLFHNYWAFDGAAAVNQFNHFLKNVSIMGALLLIVAFGPGRFSAGVRTATHARVVSRNDYVAAAGRTMLALLFLVSGYKKVIDFAATAAYMASRGMPLVEFFAVASIVLELGGGLMLVAGWKARWSAAALFVLFMIPATLIFHRFWAVDAAQVFNQTNHFLKNVAIMGGLALVAGFGPGMLSADRATPRQPGGA